MKKLLATVCGLALLAAIPSFAADKDPADKRTKEKKAAKPTITAPTDVREAIRVAGIKKAKQLGYRPIIMARSKQGEIVVLEGSLFTMTNGHFALTGGELVVIAGDQQENILGTILKQGEFGYVNKGGKCTKMQGRLVK